MRLRASLVVFISGLFLFTGCGKPNDPEAIGNSGGYKTVAKLSTPGFAQDVVLDGDYAYLAQGEGGLLVVNIQNPNNPRIVSQLTENVRGYSDKISKRDTSVYLAAGSFGITIINVANPEEPNVLVSNFSLKPANSIKIWGSYLIASVSEQGIKIAEISLPQYPDVRGGLGTYGYATEAYVSDDSSKLFVTCGEMGLMIFDISDFQDGYPSSNIAGWCDTPGYALDVVLDDARSLAFVACGYSGLQIIDYSDISDIHVVGKISKGGYAKEVLVDGNKVYLTCQKSGLQIFDVTDAANPSLTGTVYTDYAQGIAFDSKYIYVADETEGLVIIAKP